MNIVLYKGQELTNWIDYIECKFADSKYYEIDKTADKEFIIITSKSNNTKIWFYGLSKNPNILEDCQYSNDDCQGWSGEICAVDLDKYGTFNQDNLDEIDDILDKDPRRVEKRTERKGNRTKIAKSMYIVEKANHDHRAKE